METARSFKTMIISSYISSFAFYWLLVSGYLVLLSNQELNSQTFEYFVSLIKIIKLYTRYWQYKKITFIF